MDLIMCQKCCFYPLDYRTQVPKLAIGANWPRCEGNLALKKGGWAHQILIFSTF